MQQLTFLTRIAVVILLIVGVSTYAQAAEAERKDLGKHVIAGVQLDAVLINVANPASIAMGVGKTHYLEARFRPVSRKKLLTKGLVAVKVINPNGDTSPIQQMVLDNGVFSADFSLIQPGSYQILIGCRLYDGRKRQYELSYRVR